MRICKDDRMTTLEVLKWDCQMFPGDLKFNQRSLYARMLDLLLIRALQRGWHSGTANKS